MGPAVTAAAGSAVAAATVALLRRSCGALSLFGREQPRAIASSLYCGEQVLGTRRALDDRSPCRQLHNGPLDARHSAERSLDRAQLPQVMPPTASAVRRARMSTHVVLMGLHRSQLFFTC